MVLLVGSGLLARSFTRMMNAELGFDTANLLVTQIALPATTYREAADVSRFAKRLVDQLSATAVGGGGWRHVESSDSNRVHRARRSSSTGARSSPARSRRSCGYRSITPGFLAAMRTPVVRGRDFDWSDVREGVNAIVVNQLLVDQFWKGEEPIGKRIRRSSNNPRKPAPWYHGRRRGRQRQAGRSARIARPDDLLHAATPSSTTRGR